MLLIIACGDDATSDAGVDASTDTSLVDAPSDVPQDAGTDTTGEDAPAPDATEGDASESDAVATDACSIVCPTGAACVGDRCAFATQRCPDSEVVVGFDAAGLIQCASLDGTARESMNAGCRAYLGWRDACDDCTLPPIKFGSASRDACSDLAGADGVCGSQTLGTRDTMLYGLNTDGDVDGSDKFYVGFHCVAGTGDSMEVSECPADRFASALAADGTLTCIAVDEAVMDYARERCSVAFGWRDACSGCGEPPLKVGLTSSTECTLITGADSECRMHDLDGTAVWMLGINTDGDVNFDDTFSGSLICDEVAGAVTTEVECPAGTLMVGVLDDGMVECREVAALVSTRLREECELILGWRDACDACTDPPAKWGAANAVGCEVVGADSTCTEHTLGGETVRLAGINTDGDVGANDTFFVSFGCGI